MKRRSIREAAYEYLCIVVYYRDNSGLRYPKNVCTVETPNARSVGLPYSTIQDLLREEFPGSNTPRSMLRKYAHWLRQGMYNYPKKCAKVRPRTNSEEAKEDVFKSSKRRKRR